MFNKRPFTTLFLIVLVIPCAQAVSTNLCLRILQENASKNKNYIARPISLNMLRKVFPLAEKYIDTLVKFYGFNFVRSGLVLTNTTTWGIQGKYHKDHVTIQLEVDGNQQSKVQVALEILGKDDALQHEMYFLMGSTLSEAKAELGIEESHIVQVSVPMAKKHLPPDVTKPTYWSANYTLDRVAPTYGSLPPYAEEAELRLKFTELLIKKLEGNQYSANPLWKPDGIKNEIVSVGLSRVYLREVPSTRSAYRRVALEFGQDFTQQFAGDYKIFLAELLNDIDFFGAELAPIFLDSQGKPVNLNAGRSPLYLDVVANKDSQPVVWIRKILEGVLKNYALDSRP